jgi:hypothetical protein
MALIQLTDQSRTLCETESSLVSPPHANLRRHLCFPRRPQPLPAAPKRSFSLLGRGQREYETLEVGVIAMGRVTVDRPVGKMAA